MSYAPEGGLNVRLSSPLLTPPLSDASPSGATLNPRTPIETTEQLRIAIDQGGGGKVDAADPAAAPLGTDDEAGGSPNTVAQVRLAAPHEIRPRKEQRTSGLGHAWSVIGFAAFMGVSIIASAYWLL